MQEPILGQKLYINTSMSISNGSSDVAGGLATIARINRSKNLPADHYNSCFVEMEEVPGHGYNYNYLLENQDKWENDYAGQLAKPYPDVNTPWVQAGDIVNGEPWDGDDLW